MRSQHQFSQVPRADIPRSSFDLSHGHKTTFDADYLIPFLGPIDIIPGDTFNVKASFSMRLATPLYPIMDNMYAETQFFFVPYRTIWDNHEKFHGAQDDPGDSIDFTIPQIGTTSATIATGDIADYMGIPLGLNPSTAAVVISALPFRAYRKIWNDWYRDENLQNSITSPTDDGPDSETDVAWGAPPLKRGKRFDYFTSCLTAPQKGTAVSLPLGSEAQIFTKALDNESVGVWSSAGAGPTLFRTLEVPVVGDVILDTGTLADEGLYADLTNATASTINDIRLAFQTQRLLERDARSGTRYVESLKAHWGVTSPDFRLQRAEFLGGGSTRVNITPVAQTSGQATPVVNDKLGSLAGFGTVNGTHSFSKSFVEHGVLLGLISVRADLTYTQGIDRYWGKQTRYEFYYPVLSQIGEQSVTNVEIWADGSANDALVFGYQERYAEHRFISSRASGLFRPDASGTLVAWTLTEDFATLPTLGDTFITNNLGTPLDRAIAVSTEPHFFADFYFDIKAARPLPTYGVPGNIDRL